MKPLRLIHCRYLILALLLSSTASFAEFHLPFHLNHEGNPIALARADDIFQKCVNKAKRIVDQRVCESEHAAIKVCMKSEMKEKDAKAAQAMCEHLFIL
jgi:hypothetical protein